MCDDDFTDDESKDKKSRDKKSPDESSRNPESSDDASSDSEDSVEQQNDGELDQDDSQDEDEDSGDSDEQSREEELQEEKKWLQAACGSTELFSYFYKKYVFEIYNFIYQMTSNVELTADLTGETFMLAILNYRNFKMENITLRPWLYTIARNLVARYFNRDKAEKNALNEYAIRQESVDWNPLDDLIHDENTKIILKLLRTLDPLKQEIIILKEWHKHTFKDISKILDMNENTVKAQYYRGLRKLKQLWDEHHDNPEDGNGS